MIVESITDPELKKIYDLEEMNSKLMSHLKQISVNSSALNIQIDEKKNASVSAYDAPNFGGQQKQLKKKKKQMLKQSSQNKNFIQGLKMKIPSTSPAKSKVRSKSPVLKKKQQKLVQRLLKPQSAIKEKKMQKLFDLKAMQFHETMRSRPRLS